MNEQELKEKFEETMTAAGWQPEQDTMEIVYRWRHPDDKIGLTYKVAWDHWRTHGEAPVPIPF